MKTKMDTKQYSKIAVLFILAIGLNPLVAQGVEQGDIKLVLRPNQKHEMRMTSKTNVSQTSQGQVSKTVREEIVEVAFHVQEVNPEGDAVMKVTFGKLKTKAQSPGGTLEFDSTKADANPGNPLAPMYNALIGQSFKIKVASNGKILELQSLDEMIAKMAEKMVAAEDKKMDKTVLQKLGTRKQRKEKIIKLLKMYYFGEEKIRTMMRGFIQILPSGPVKPGDSWESKIDIEYLQRTRINLKNTLKKHENDKAVIDSTYKTNPNEKPIRDKSNPNMVFTKIDYQGSAQIDKSSGWIIRKEVKASFSAESRLGRKTMPVSADIVKIIERVTSMTKP